MGDTTRRVRDPALDGLKVIVKEVQTSMNIRDQRSPRRRYHTRELRRFLAYRVNEVQRLCCWTHLEYLWRGRQVVHIAYRHNVEERKLPPL